MWERRIHIERPIKIENLVTAFTVFRDKNFRFRGEVHDFWEMVYISEGIAGITAGGKVFECGAGNIVFHKPNEYHRIWTAGDEAIKFTVISFTSASEYLTEKLSESVITLSVKAKKLMEELQSTIGISEKLENYLPDEFLKESNEIKIAEFANTLELLLYECAGLEKYIAPKSRGDAKIFTAAVKSMNDHIGEPFNSGQIADEIHVSITHLKRVFNRYALMGVHEYYLAMKLERAKIMLAHGESVHKTAAELGFLNPNYFSAVFKREIGISPTAWLKDYIKSEKIEDITD